MELSESVISLGLLIIQPLPVTIHFSVKNMVCLPPVCIK